VLEQWVLTVRVPDTSTPILHYSKYSAMAEILRIDRSTPTLQKPEGFRVKASEDEVVVLYFESSATQNLNSSGFPEG
jgi:hypothetical protein